MELRTTFTDGTTSRTKSIWYLVVNANSAYNILLGRPALNILRAVPSTRHMKMKLPDLSSKVIVIKSDQEEARKCYENSLKTKRGMVMVIERPLVSGPATELGPIEEATPAESTPDDALPTEVMPVDEVCTKERRCDTLPVEGESEEATPMEEDPINESRPAGVQHDQPQPEDSAVESEIGGKAFKLGRHLSQEERRKVTTVISRHLDAFAWTAADMPGIDPDFLSHRLTMDTKARPVRQRRRKFNEGRCLVIKEETQNLPTTRAWRNRFAALSAPSTRLSYLQNHPQNLL